MDVEGRGKQVLGGRVRRAHGGRNEGTMCRASEEMTVVYVGRDN